MAISSSRVLIFIALAYLLACCELSLANKPNTPTYPVRSFSRRSFPKGFLFGGASSSYQYEGAVKEDGRGPSIWDTFVHNYPEKILDQSNNDIADDFYHRYKEDLTLAKSLGLDAFRFSISWPRLLPQGKLSKGINKKGIKFYNDLIDTILAKGLTPFATIFHWDLPQELEDDYGGFLSPKFVRDYTNFAGLCFKEFGDRVKFWSTFNEPWTFTSAGYDSGVFAPGRCSSWMNNNCTGGNSGTEPYIVGHHLLLSHASAVKLYREKYKPAQKGEIGIVLVTNFMYPYSNSEADIKATQRGIDFMYGWFVDPITFGDYPKSMRELVGKRLPKFTPQQTAMLKDSYDFLGLNYYTSNYVKDAPNSTDGVHLSYTTDARTSLVFQNSKGQLIGAPTGASSFFVYPKGLYDLLVYTKKNYKNPAIYICENGLADANNGTNAQLIKDTQRLDFYVRHLHAVHRAIKDGVRMKGYFAWSFLDTWEWNSGFTMRFGIVFVDYKNELKRIVKLSGNWFKNFLKY